MKFLFSFAILLCLLQSCTTYYFTIPQPSGGEKLAEIPENLRGTWNCGYDSSGERICNDQKGYVITANEITIKDNKKPIIWKIGQDVELLKSDDFFVLNLINKDKMYTSKGKQVESPLYSALVLSESEGAITIWNVDRPWNTKSARKFRKAEILSDKMVIDTTSNETNLLLKFSLNVNDLEQISLLKPTIMLSDSTILSGDDIEWGDYSCGEIVFENKSDERKYYRLENKLYRMIEKQTKIERKQNVLAYNNQFAKVFGDAQKGYMLVISQEPYTDTTRIKRELFFSDVPMYDVFYIIEFDKDVVPAEYHRNLCIDEMKIIPAEVAQELIKTNRISYETFRDSGKSNEKGEFHWNHLSDEDKEFLQQFVLESDH